MGISTGSTDNPTPTVTARTTSLRRDPHPGLYDQLQGTSVKNLGDPETAAKMIAESLGRTCEVPSGWGNRYYSTSSSGSVEDDELFRFELLEMTECDLSQSIRPGGHWEFSIRPASYTQERLEYPSIYATMRESYFRHTHWDFPSMDGEQYAQSGAFWKGEEFPNGYQEVWRISQTGQFVSLIGFPPDLEKLIVSSAREGNLLTQESLFSVHSAVIYVTAAFECAATLCRSQPSWPPIVIEIRANEISGRILATDRRLIRSGVNSTAASRYVETFRPKSEDLINNPHVLAVQYLQNLFQRFGWNDALVQDIQSSWM